LYDKGNCLYDFNPEQEGLVPDNVGDVCDPDDDNDGLCDDENLVAGPIRQGSLVDDKGLMSEGCFGADECPLNVGENCYTIAVCPPNLPVWFPRPVPKLWIVLREPDRSDQPRPHDHAIQGIGHTSWLLAQRPSLGVMLNP
jgi:hypothetical protein